MTKEQEENKKLVEKYPFLRPLNWLGEEIEDYDYSFTELDEMPVGWKIAFGEKMCEEIKEELLRFNYLDTFRIIQLKEKYGAMRLYPSVVPSGSNVCEIIRKYEKLSERICAGCGKEATQISKGWICPWCDDCAKEIGGEFTSIDEYYKEPTIKYLRINPGAPPEFEDEEKDE